MFIFKSIKTQLILFLIVFSVYLGIINHDISFFQAVSFSVFFAVLYELCFYVLKRRNPVILESAVITGLIIALVLGGGQNWRYYIVVPFLAITSKHVIRIKNCHIFNPAAFGLLLATILLPIRLQWLGTYQWYILLPFGLYFIYKIRKLELLISYLAVLLIVWGGQVLSQGGNPMIVFGFLSYFFVFVMLIEPKTTPITKFGKIGFGAVAGLFVLVLTQAGLTIDVELGSLLIANTCVPLLNKLKYRK